MACGKDVEKLARVLHGVAILENNLAAPEKVTYKMTVWLPGAYPREMQKLWVFIAAPSILAPTGKPPRCPSTGEPIDNTWYSHTLEHYSGIKRKGLLLLSGRRQTQRPHIWFHWYEMPRKGNSTETESGLLAAWGWGGEEWLLLGSRGLSGMMQTFSTGLW